MLNLVSKKAIDYACDVCDTIMRKFKPSELPPAGLFHYHQGVLLSGMLNTYNICKEEKYYEYAKAWVDSIVYDDGSINTFCKERLDDLQPGILLIYLYKRTHQKKYKIALGTIMEIIRKWPKNEAGGFWHKYEHPNEMWLDGLYMVGPLEAEYSSVFGDEYFIETAIKQAFVMYDNMRDEDTGLLYHAWDYTKKKGWADKKTGLSPTFWGRALGWYVVAVLSILDFLPEGHKDYQRLCDIEASVLKSLLRYQNSERGLWYQVVNKGDRKENWLETSCSALFAYSLAKAVRKKVLPEEYYDCALKGFNGVISTLTYDNDDVLISGICKGKGVSDDEGYFDSPTSVNDLHGVGAFLLMASEISLIEQGKIRSDII